MKIVFDTNVIVDHIRAKDPDCSSAVHETIKGQHVTIVCEKLLREYQRILTNGHSQLYSLVNPLLMQIFPIDQLLKRNDPKIKIAFGPPEDRFHMQLAIDTGADYHVTKDGGILAEAANMSSLGVKETNPTKYVFDIKAMKQRRCR